MVAPEMIDGAKIDRIGANTFNANAGITFVVLPQTFGASGIMPSIPEKSFDRSTYWKDDRSLRAAHGLDEKSSDTVSADLITSGDVVQ